MENDEVNKENTNILEGGEDGSNVPSKQNENNRNAISQKNEQSNEAEQVHHSHGDDRKGAQNFDQNQNQEGKKFWNLLEEFYVLLVKAPIKFCVGVYIYPRS